MVLWDSTALAHFEAGQLIMMAVGFGLLYLAIVKKFEPLLLLPIGFGALLTNIPIAGFSEAGGLLHYIYKIGIDTGVFPLLIFMGVGAMTDFSALIANPKMLLLGAAAQFGIFATLFGAIALNLIPGFEFTLKDASAIPIIQPPIMKALTTKEEREIKMGQLRPVSKREKIIFPLAVLFMTILFLPAATPLVGMFCFGNLMKECGVVDRLSKTAQNELINTVTIFLGLAVGSKLSAEAFLTVETLGILGLGAIAFGIGTAAGVLMAKLMSKLSGGSINPLIGAAGVSAVPMAARVVNKVGLEANPHNFLLMHAMGPNVAGVLGSAVAAGILLALVG